MKYELSERIILQNLTPEKRIPEICPLCAFFNNPELCQKFTCETEDAQNHNKTIPVIWRPKKVDGSRKAVFSNRFLDYAHKTSWEKVREISNNVIAKTVANQNIK